MLTLVLLVTAAIAAYSLLVLAMPTHRCSTCKGTRIDRTGRRPRACRKCKLTGRQQWPLGPTIHRLYWQTIGARWRERRRAEVTERIAAREGKRHDLHE